MKYALSTMGTLVFFILFCSCNKDNVGINTGNPGTCDDAGIVIETRISADTVFISPNGGIAPYFYSIDGSYFSLLNTFANLDMGDNTLYVQDSRGCIKLSKVHINYKSTALDSRNGYTYRAVKIGNQVWMGENLKFPVAGNKECYGGIDASCEDFGILYTWKSITSACPTGYRLPNEADFNILTDTLSKSGDTYTLLTSGGSNEFAAKLFGYKDNGYINLGKGTAFWINDFTVSGADTLYTGFELSESNQISFKSFSDSAALYVRCIRE